MEKILTIEKATDIVQQLKGTGKKIVVVGGAFDLIHRGHIEFLEKAKEKGDVLLVFLESDKKIQEIKGMARPMNRQADRAFVLSKFSMVDYVLLLPYFKENLDYEKLVKMLQPDIIAVTKADGLISLKRKYAIGVGGRLVEVISRIKNYSTSKLEENL